MQRQTPPKRFMGTNGGGERMKDDRRTVCEFVYVLQHTSAKTAADISKCIAEWRRSRMARYLKHG